jgi:predicted TIM-barrel fold metal-dependent hydrolase
MRYETAIDVTALAAIDVHVHCMRSSRQQSPQVEATSILTAAGGLQTLDEEAAYYRERKIAFCVFGMDVASTGGRGVGTDEVLEAARRNADIMIPFANVDPKRGKEGVEDAKRYIEAGVRGFKFHPPAGAYYANDEICYPLYEVLAKHRMIALFHTGQTAVGQGAPGGRGIRIKYGNPLFLDDVAVDFPDMPIIMAHPSVPWQDEAISIALHKPQVYIDLSGWSPKYFPPQLIQNANTLLKKKVLFGSDHPMITPDRWLADFQAASFRDEVRPLILKENAARLLGLSKP